MITVTHFRRGESVILKIPNDRVVAELTRPGDPQKIGGGVLISAHADVTTAKNEHNPVMPAPSEHRPSLVFPDKNQEKRLSITGVYIPPG